MKYILILFLSLFLTNCEKPKPVIVQHKLLFAITKVDVRSEPNAKSAKIKTLNIDDSVYTEEDIWWRNIYASEWAKIYNTKTDTIFSPDTASYTYNENISVIANVYRLFFNPGKNHAIPIGYIQLDYISELTEKDRKQKKIDDIKKAKQEKIDDIKKAKQKKIDDIASKRYQQEREIEIRKAYAQNVRLNMLDLGINMHVSTSGKEHNILTFKYSSMGDVMVHTLRKSGSVFIEKGFKVVIFTNGYNYTQTIGY